jgi:hypothetical protein
VYWRRTLCFCTKSVVCPTAYYWEARKTENVLHQQYHRTVTTDLYRKCSCAINIARQLPSWDWNVRCFLYTAPSVSRSVINFLMYKLCSFSEDKNYFISTFLVIPFEMRKYVRFVKGLYCIFKMEAEFSLSHIENLCNRLPDIVYQNTVIFRIISSRKSNKNVYCCYQSTRHLDQKPKLVIWMHTFLVLQLY